MALSFKNKKFKTIINETKIESCTFTIGMLCDNFQQCSGCTMGLRGKKAEKRITTTMGFGLFACENIKITRILHDI